MNIELILLNVIREAYLETAQLQIRSGLEAYAQVKEAEAQQRTAQRQAEMYRTMTK